MGKSLSNKYGQKLLDSAKKSTKKQVLRKNLEKQYQIMKQKKMQKKLLIRKDTYLQKKGNKLLMN